MQKKRVVLLIEDDCITAEGLRVDLEQVGVKVFTTNSGAMAMEFLDAENGIDLAIVDYKLPGQSGAALGRDLLNKHGIPFVLLTGYADIEIIDEAAAAGAFAYIVKPASAHELLPLIETSIARANEMKEFVALSGRVSAAAESKRQLNVVAGIVMERFALSETDALRLIRHYARSNRITLDDAAARVRDRTASLELLAALSRMLEKA